MQCEACSRCWQHSTDRTTVASHVVAASRFRHFRALHSGNPMKTIRHTNTLFYYDGPQVFEARDAIGGHYVAVMVETDHTSERYLVAGVAPEQLRQFRSGMLDLRSLLIESDKEERYLATVGSGLDNPLVLEHLRTPLIDRNLLPAPGFVLHDWPSDDSVLREAWERQNLVLKIAAEPPEAATQHRIRANTLAEMLHRVQLMIKYAYRAAIRGKRNRYRQPDEDMMNVVVPAAAGSFQIVLEAVSLPNLFGHSDLANGLRRIDDLFEDTANPEKTLTVAKEYRGHLAGAYLKLLRFLVKQKTGLRYSWAEPKSERSSNRAVLESEAGPLIDILSRVTNLGSEPVTLEGTFEKFNRESGLWGLLTDEGKRSGKIRDGGPGLDGLEVGGLYRFHCDEEIEGINITGRESRVLYLNQHEPI